MQGGRSLSFEVEADSMRSSTSIQHWMSLPSKYQRESLRPRSAKEISHVSSGLGEGGSDLSGVPAREN